MIALGYNEYGTSLSYRFYRLQRINDLFISLTVTQGGDWGALVSNVLHMHDSSLMSSQITRKMASVYGGRHHKAWHTNMPVYVIFLFKTHIDIDLFLPM
jgi:hypothetical protein